MESKGAAAVVSPPVYEDFVPTSDLVQEEDCDTLLLNLTGFNKEQMRIQLTRTGILKISGQRQVGQNKWVRFQKDFPVSENCDKNKLSARFENGILYVKQPKLIISEEEEETESPTPDTEQPKKPTDHEQQQAQKKDEENAKSAKTTPTEELPKQANEENALPKQPVKQESKTTEKAVAEKTGASSIVEEENKTSDDSELENAAIMGTVAALAEKLKMPRKVMNMTLVAILVLGIGVFISHMMKSNSYQAEE